MAAVHCPRFLKPEQASCALVPLPNSFSILAASFGLSASLSLTVLAPLVPLVAELWLFTALLSIEQWPTPLPPPPTFGPPSANTGAAHKHRSAAAVRKLLV